MTKPTHLDYICSTCANVRSVEVATIPADIWCPVCREAGRTAGWMAVVGSPAGLKFLDRDRSRCMAPIPAAPLNQMPELAPGFCPSDPVPDTDRCEHHTPVEERPIDAPLPLSLF